MSDVSPSNAAKPAFRYRYVVLGMLCVLSMVTYLDRVCFGSAADDIARDLGFETKADLKWVFTAFSIAYAVFEVPCGWLGDRWGPRGTLLRIVAWWSVCTALTGVVGLKMAGTVWFGFGALVTLRFLFGAGEAGAYPNIARAIHNWFPRSEWERAQGMIWMSGRLMGGLTPLLWALLVAGTAWTSPLTSWRGAFVFFGVIGIAWCVVFSLMFKNRPAEHPSVSPAEREEIGSGDYVAAEHHHAPWGRIFTHPGLWALCVLYFLITYSWVFNVTYLPSYMKQRFEVADSSVVGALYKGAPLWVGAIGCLLGGVLVSRASAKIGNRHRGRQVVTVPALALCSLCFLAARAAPNEHLFCLFIAGSGFCIDLTLGACWASCQDLGRRHVAVVAAVMNTVGTAGSAFANWFTGTLLEWQISSRAQALNVPIKALSPTDKNAAELFGYDQAFITFFVAAAIASAFWLLVDPRRPVDPRDEH